MTVLPHTWTETLVPYLDRCDEDLCTLRFFVEHLLTSLRRMPRIRWLEVGPGPGTKTGPILEHLSQLGFAVELLCVEPSATAWRGHGRLPPAASVFSGHLGAFLAATGPTDFDLVTCFHVLYDPEAIDQFGALLRRTRQSSTPTTVGISVESETSDFHRMRAELRAIASGLPAPATEGVRGMLRRLEVQATEVEIGPQRCCLRDRREVRDWLLPFLLGAPVAETPDPAMQRLVERFVVERDLCLDVPDTGFIFSLHA